MEGVTKRLIDHLQSKRVSHVYSNFYIIIQNSENRSFQDDITLFKNIRLSRNDRILEVIFHFFHGYSKMIME